MKYKIINKTKIPRKLIKEFIEFSCPKGLDDFVVYLDIEENKLSGGLAYADIRIAKLKMSDKEYYPQYNTSRSLKKFGYTPTFIIRNKKELLLSLISHELRHLWQFNVSKQMFSAGKIRQFIYVGMKYNINYKMEADACRYAKKMVNEYRKLKEI
jgi:hypothetical protein